MACLVVFECRDAAGQALWAWGRVAEGTAGFSEITYTHRDGLSFASVEGEPPTLGAFLFAVPE